MGSATHNQPSPEYRAATLRIANLLAAACSLGAEEPPPTVYVEPHGLSGLTVADLGRLGREILVLSEEADAQTATIRRLAAALIVTELRLLQLAELPWWQLLRRVRSAARGIAADVRREIGGIGDNWQERVWAEIRRQEIEP